MERAAAYRWRVLLALVWLGAAAVACSGESNEGGGAGGGSDASGVSDSAPTSDAPGIPEDAARETVDRDGFTKPDADPVSGDAGEDLGGPDAGRCPEKTPCDDGDPCTTQDECDAEGVCRGVPYTCDDGLFCTRNVCLGDGDCEFVMRAGHCRIDGVCYREGDASPTNPCVECTTPASSIGWTPDDRNGCDDGDPCTVSDVCRGGTCQGAPRPCDDGEPCTDDTCDAVTGECAHTANTASCDDGDPCTLGDVCAAGSCSAGAETVDCEDGNPCTANSCAPGVGCRSDIVMDGPCDDASACTENDRCVIGACDGDVVHCAGPNPCIDYVCDPQAGCQEIPNDDPCEDLNPCTVGDFCANGQCRAGSESPCDDNNGCTRNLCYPTVACNEQGVCIPAGGCRFVNAAGPCEDADPCTIGDYCANGSCVGGSAALDCDDGNLCTADSCVPGEGCAFDPTPGECTDGNPCTVGDRCEDGVCVGGADPTVCDDHNPCTDDLCDAITGCRYVPNSAPCDDGNPCTVGDFCQFTQCRRGPDPLDCDDGDVCTTDSCLLLFGCEHSYNTASCEDGDPCTVGDTCSVGACLSGGDDLDCDDANDCTDDACVPFEGCLHTPNVAPCDDVDPCTVTDACVDGVCVGSGWLECEDQGPCTNEFCEPGTGCTATVVNDFACRPQMIITSPERGAFLTPPTDVEVRGYILAPAGPITHAYINDFPLDLDEDYNFSHVIQGAHHGMNVIVGDCRDIWNSTDHVVQAFLMGTRYNPIDVANPTNSMILNAIQAYLGASVFDDGDEIPDDVAAIIELVAEEFDINGLIPNPVTSGSVFPCGYDVSIGTIDYGKPEVSIQPDWAGLKVVVSISYLYAPVDVDWCFGVSGRANLEDLRVEMLLGLSIGADGFADATLTQVVVEVGSVDVTIGGALGFLSNWIVDFFEGDFAVMIEDVAYQQLGPPVEQAIEAALNSLALNQEIQVPALLPGMVETSLTIITRLNEISFSPLAVIPKMKTVVVAPKGTPYDPAGALVWDNCMQGNVPDLEFGDDWELWFGLHDDFLNQILYAAYWAGLLELTVDVDALLPGGLNPGTLPIPGGLSDVTITVSAMLPPVITSCNAWDDILIQMGDVRIDGTFGMLGLNVEMTLYASLEMTGNVGLVDTEAGNEITIQVEGVNFVEIEVSDLNDELVGNEGAIGDLLEGFLLPMALEAIEGQSFGFAIPSIDVGSLAPDLGLPPNLVLSIDIQSFYREFGYTILGGEVRGSN